MAGKLLIADNTVTNRIVLKVTLAGARYQVLQAATGPDAVELALAERPDLVLLDAHLPDGGAAAVCAALRADPRTRAIPIIVIDGVSTREARLATLRAGADDYMARPLDEAALLALVRRLLRTRASFDELSRRQETAEDLGFAEAARGFIRKSRVAVIAPAADSSVVWRRMLGLALPAQIIALSQADALDGAGHNEAPDAYVIAADLARRGDGLRLVSELRSRSDSHNAVILVLDETNTAATVSMALDIGANAVVTGKFDPQEIAARLDMLLARKLETDVLRASFDKRLSLAMQDPLTGLYNRRYAETYLRRLADETMHSGQPFALMLLDLDHFKGVNDRFGHSVGDEVLIETARRLRANMREMDLLARYGGEEFVIALPETDLAAASRMAERLRRVIGETPIRAANRGIDVAVTISIGVCIFDGRGQQMPRMRALIDEADAALYASKAEGRNLVTFAHGQAA